MISLIKKRFERYLQGQITMLIRDQLRPGGTLSGQDAKNLGSRISVSVNEAFERNFKKYQQAGLLRK
jgi:hypothetical protein